MRPFYLFALLSIACSDDPLVTDAGTDAAAPDAGLLDAPTLDAPTIDAGLLDAGLLDAPTLDAGASDAPSDAATDAGIADAGTDVGMSDAGMRTNVTPGFCPSVSAAAGLYRGTLASNLNDLSGGCGLSAAGRDGALRIELAPGETVRARYRHAGDGALYLLDSCPVVGSCLVGSDTSGEESITWTNSGAVLNPVYLVLDSDALAGPQTFELDLFIDAP